MRTPDQIKAQRWAWMMDWCKKRGVAPANNDNWNRAAMAWIRHVDRLTEEDEQRSKEEMI